MSISCDPPSGDGPHNASMETGPQSGHHEHQLRPSFRRRAHKADIMSISCDPPSGDGPQSAHHEHQLRPSFRRRAPQREHHEHQLRLSLRRRAHKAGIMSISCDPPSGDGPQSAHHEHQLRRSFRRRDPTTRAS